MKKAYLTGLLALITLPAYAQDKSGNQQNTIPSTPAFSILDFEPATVMHPTTNKDLAADVLSGFDQQGKLVPNLGLEVSPYWLKSHPTLSQQTYLLPDPGQTFLQSLSISAATVRDSATGVNRLGAGFRFKLYNGKPIDSLAIVQKSAQASLNLITYLGAARGLVMSNTLTTRAAIITFLTPGPANAQVAPALLQNAQSYANSVMVKYTDSNSDLLLFIQDVISYMNTASQPEFAQLASMLYDRKGFIVEVAGASAFNTAGGDTWQKIGLWLNTSYYASRTDQFTATMRLQYRNGDTAKTNFDAGISYLKQGPKYNVSVEGAVRVYRLSIPDVNMTGEKVYRIDNGFAYRIAAQGSYSISNTISVNMSFGKSFKDAAIKGQGFFSILGVNYSLFGKPLLSHS